MSDISNQTPNVPTPPAVPQMPMYPMPKKTVFHSTGRDLIFAGLLMAATYALSAIGLPLHLGFSIVFSALFVLGTVYLSKKGCRAGAFALTCGVLAEAMMGVFFATSNGPVRVLSAVVSVLLLWIYFAGLSGKRVPEGDLGLLSLWFGSFGNALIHLFPTLRALFSGENEKKKHAIRAVIGVLCALPVLGAVIPLLIRSDAAFENMVSGLFADIGTLIARVIFTLIFSPFLVSFLFSLRHHEKPFTKMKEPKGAENIFWISFLTVLSICYGAYLFSQLAYFFSAFSGILPKDYVFSYAEYARRGFFELCGIAGINLCLMLLMLLFSRKKNGKLSGVLRGFGTFIGLFTLLLIATAISKMVLYIGVYGMTVLRVGTSAFMVFMAVVFLAVILRMYVEKVRVLQTATITAALVLLVLGIGNINAVVAKYNFDAYQSGSLEKIDVEYLGSLGPEATPYILKLCETDPSEKNLSALELLYNQEYLFDYVEGDENTPEHYTITDKWYSAFGDRCIPRSKSYALLDDYYKEHPNFFVERSQAANEAVTIEED